MCTFRSLFYATNICSGNKSGSRMRSRRELLVVKNLIRRGYNDKEISTRTGIPRRTVSDWRRGNCGTRIRAHRFGDYRCIEKHDFSRLRTLKYAYLLGLYLGDGCISEHARKVFHMRIALDAAYPGIIDECCAALEALFSEKTAYRHKRRHCNCVEVSMYSKHWPCFFPQHGRSRKHLRQSGWRPGSRKSSTRTTSRSCAA
jgi:Homeodomain-like domain